MADSFQLTTGTLAAIGAWGLVLGTLFFVWLGLREERDFFLMMGLMCTLGGNLVFAGYLWDQDADGQGGSNATMVTLYLSLAAASVCGIVRQFNEYREKGWGVDSDDEEEDSEEEEKAAAAAKRGQGQAKQLPSGSNSSKRGGKEEVKALPAPPSSVDAEEAAEKEALRAVARAAIAAAKVEQKKSK